ncbi:MAG: hypothetical protein JWO41_427 [Candidatus Saccharibacteria bacterium]|nr:hypothetical protein [Candidatus Saccharibacteria bacterium]
MTTVRTPDMMVDPERLWLAHAVQNSMTDEEFIQDPKYNPVIIKEAARDTLLAYHYGQVGERIAELREETAALRAAQMPPTALEQFADRLDNRLEQVGDRIFAGADKLEERVRTVIDTTATAITESTPQQRVAGALLFAIGATGLGQHIGKQAAEHQPSVTVVSQTVIPVSTIEAPAVPHIEARVPQKHRQEAVGKLTSMITGFQEQLGPYTSARGRELGNAQAEALVAAMQHPDELQSFDVESFKKSLSASQLADAKRLSKSLAPEFSQLSNKEQATLPLMLALVFDSYSLPPEHHQPVKHTAVPKHEGRHAKPHAVIKPHIDAKPRVAAKGRHESDINIEAYTGIGWTKEDLLKVRANEAVYKHAAAAYDLPWQMLPVFHKREHNLAKTNPDNRQGIYQDTHANYAPGPVSDAEFLAQTMKLAKQIRDDYSQRGMRGVELTAKSIDAQKVMDTFGRYNGIPKLYRRQARALGYSSHQSFMGSPYVVNMLSEAQNSHANSHWLQYRSDGKNVKLANQQPGAWVMFKDLVIISGDYGKLHNQIQLPTAPATHVTHAEHEANLPLPAKFSDGTIYYSQYDKRWSHKIYAKPGRSQTIAASGCAPTTEAAVITTLTGDTKTPDELAAWNIDHGFRTDNSGTDHTSFEAAPEAFGLQATNVTGNAEAIKSTLQDGGMVIMNVKDTDPNLPGTSSGHVIALRGMTDGGEVQVMDPNSLEMSQKTFDLNRLLQDSHSTDQVAVQK